MITIGITDSLLAIAVGLGATLVMDLWLLVRRRWLRIPPLDYCLVGRWLLHMPGGVFTHASIAAAARKRGECTVGRFAHYGIGALFGVALVLLATPRWLQQPTLAPALLWGVATAAAPLLVMQPAFGLGLAASRTPDPARVRLHNLLTHTVYGVGLYLSGLAVSTLLLSRG